MSMSQRPWMAPASILFSMQTITHPTCVISLPLKYRHDEPFDGDSQPEFRRIPIIAAIPSVATRSSVRCCAIIICCVVEWCLVKQSDEKLVESRREAQHLTSTSPPPWTRNDRWWRWWWWWSFVMCVVCMCGLICFTYSCIRCCSAACCVCIPPIRRSVVNYPNSVFITRYCGDVCDVWLLETFHLLVLENTLEV